MIRRERRVELGGEADIGRVSSGSASGTGRNVTGDPRSVAGGGGTDTGDDRTDAGDDVAGGGPGDVGRRGSLDIWSWWARRNRSVSLSNTHEVFDPLSSRKVPSRKAPLRLR